MTYRWIPGLEGQYAVNAHGCVLSHVNGRERCLRWCRSSRYPTVRVAGKHRRVHELVLLAFHGPRPDGCDASHLNDDPLDNRAENLVWESHRANCQRRKPFPINARKGEGVASSKLTEKKVREILELKGTGVSACEVGRRFGVTDVQVGNIWKGRSWRHVSCA